MEEEELPFKSTPAPLSTFIHVASAAIHRNPGRVFAALAFLFIAFIGLSTKRARNPATAAQRRSSGGGARPENAALECIVGYAGDNQRLHLERPRGRRGRKLLRGSAAAADGGVSLKRDGRVTSSANEKQPFEGCSGMKSTRRGACAETCGRSYTVRMKSPAHPMVPETRARPLRSGLETGIHLQEPSRNPEPAGSFKRRNRNHSEITEGKSSACRAAAGPASLWNPTSAAITPPPAPPPPPPPSILPNSPKLPHPLLI